MISPDQAIMWSEMLAGIARTGLAFTESVYERERFEEVLKVAATMRNAAHEESVEEADIVDAWKGSVVAGVPGYVTPKVAVGAAVVNEFDELLLIQRSDNGNWLYPTGWADIGYSPSEVVVKEVQEETGVDVEVERPIAIFDSYRIGATHAAFYTMLFLCRAKSTELTLHPEETIAGGWFKRDTFPEPLAGNGHWVDLVWAAVDNPAEPVYFDAPRPENT